METIFLTNFTDSRFQKAFQVYFEELGIHVKNWEGVFAEMNGDSHGNAAYVRLDGERVVGFIQFCPMELSGWFFTKELGFIREFWIAPEYRGQGHGTALLGLAEGWFQSRGFAGAILTTNTAPGFYTRLGYRLDPGFSAKNGDPVFVKDLPPLKPEAGVQGMTLETPTN